MLPIIGRNNRTRDLAHASKLRDLFDTFEQDLNRELSTLLHGYGFPRVPSVASDPHLLTPLDVEENENSIEIKVDVPGMTKDDIKVYTYKDKLVVEGEKKQDKEPDKEDNKNRYERFYGKFRREVQLPQNVNTNNIDATAKNGVLYLNIPKTEEEEEEVNKIDVKSE